MPIKYTLRCLVAVSCLLATTAHAERKPNVIVIMADDIGHTCYGSYGSQQYKTPRLDALAKGGVRFTQAYAQPLCTPSRIKLMTGKSNTRNYLAFGIIAKDEYTFGHLFQRAGYATAVAGKWQLHGSDAEAVKTNHGYGALPERAGFDEHCLWQVKVKEPRFWKPTLRINGEVKRFGENTYGPDVCVDFINGFIERHKDMPFFVYYPMILTHGPMTPTPDSADRKSRNAQRNFEDMVAYMDKCIGRIVDKLDELGLRDDTLILVTGDNGSPGGIKTRHNGRSIRGGKSKMTDDGTRVAFIASMPGAAKAGVCDDLVDFSDVLPTVAEWAGLALPADQKFDGVSFAPQLRGETGTPRDWLFCYYHARPTQKSVGRAWARDKRFKLYRTGDLFDVTNDVEEKKPIAPADDTAESKSARAKLRAVLDSFPKESLKLRRAPVKRK